MTDEVKQKTVEFLQGLPDDQLREMRKAASKEMKRRGLKPPREQGEGGEQKAGGGGKRKRASANAE